MSIGSDKQFFFAYKNVNIFLPISLNNGFGFSKKPLSHSGVYPGFLEGGFIYYIKVLGRCVGFILLILSYFS